MNRPYRLQLEVWSIYWRIMCVQKSNQYTHVSGSQSIFHAGHLTNKRLNGSKTSDKIMISNITKPFPACALPLMTLEADTDDSSSLRHLKIKKITRIISLNF